MNVAEVKRNGFGIKMSVLAQQGMRMLKHFRREIMCYFAGLVLSFAKLGGVGMFAPSFVCACGKEKLFALFGALTGAFFQKDGLFFAVSAILAFVSHVVLKKQNVVGILNVIFSAMISSLAFGTVNIFMAIPYALMMAVFSCAYTGLFHHNRALAPVAADGGFLCLAFAVPLAFSGVNIGGFQFSVIAAAFFCLEGSERGGYLLGGLSGFFVSVVLGMEYVVPFVFGGFLCGICIRKYRAVGVVSLIVIGLVFCAVFSGGIDLLGFVISISWGSLIWYLASETVYNGKSFKRPLTEIIEEKYMGKKLSAAVGSISLMLSSVSKAKRRGREERVRLVIDGIFSAECETCTGCTFPTEKAKMHLCSCVTKNKKIHDRDFTENFISHCSRWEVIKDKINKMIEENPEKTSLRIDTLAKDYMAMSRLLALGERRAENRCFSDVKTAQKIKMALEMKNIRTLTVEVVGTRLPTVEITGIPFKLPFPERIIKNTVEKHLSKAVNISLLESEGKMAKMRFKAVCPMKAEFYKISIPKKGEIICGDSSAVFEDDDGRFYSIISDGMGSGRDAAVCSRLGTSFLEKLITAGIDKAGAVSMLGNIIASSEDEVFTTVDMAEMDLVRRKLTLIKAGASPTWILREGRAYSVTSKTMPCGIIAKTNAEQTVLDLLSGDVIIMGSDGGECAVSEVLGAIIKEKICLDPKELASSLLDRAVKKNGRGDDISFCVMRVT